jgi:DNA-binding IclR family transcriptional regulator
MRVHMDAGERIPLHASASGQACLAFMPEDDARQVLSGNLMAFTAHTVTDRTALLEQIEMVRRNGFAEVDQGFEEGVYGMAAPIFSPQGTVTGSVGVATPITRVNDDFRTRTRDLILEAAGDITSAWGGGKPRFDVKGTAA